jgi:hypothetical protein
MQNNNRKTRLWNRATAEIVRPLSVRQVPIRPVAHLGRKAFGERKGKCCQMPVPMLSGSLVVLFKRGGRRTARVGAGSPAAAAAFAVAAGCLPASPLLAVGLVYRKTLDNTVPSQHAAVDGEVSAHHECTHGGVLLGQHVRFVCKIRLILAAVHENQASVTTAVTVTLVHRVLPSTTPAKACWDERKIVSPTF